MTGVQADALALYLCTIRPDWSKRFVLEALREAQSISSDLERVTRVSVRAALTASIIRPSVIAMRGAHWRAQADTAPEPPTYGNRCDDCSGIHATASPCDPEQPAEAAEYIGQLRAQLKRHRA